MSEAGYDGETCQSCEHKNKDLNRWPCSECREMSNFRISLQCRQVRAEEEANKLREEANRCLRIASAALERIADSLRVLDLCAHSNQAGGNVFGVTKG